MDIQALDLQLLGPCYLSALIPLVVWAAPYLRQRKDGRC